MFLAERPINAPGSAVLCSVEGSRPILVEVQALVSSSTYGNARRMASGIDQQRLTLLLAVLEKRAGLNLIGDDVFVNIAGGMTVDEPASDLGVLAAIASSVRNRVIPATTAMFGEVGLAGEVRGISQAPLRIREAAQMGFRRCIMPEANIDPADRGQLAGECELVGVRTVGEHSTPFELALPFVTIGDIFPAGLLPPGLFFIFFLEAAISYTGLPHGLVCARTGIICRLSHTPRAMLQPFSVGAPGEHRLRPVSRGAGRLLRRDACGNRRHPRVSCSALAMGIMRLPSIAHDRHRHVLGGQRRSPR